MATTSFSKFDYSSCEPNTQESLWKTLEHKGPYFPPPYEQMPEDVKFIYDNKEMNLSKEAEEVASMYARMLDKEYTTNKVFNQNFFDDWRKIMSPEEKEKISDFSKCNFKPMYNYFLKQAKENEEKSKEERQNITDTYGFCEVDGKKQQTSKFRIQPPGLFKGRGGHPKMGKVKMRIVPEDVIINCSRGSKIPAPPHNCKWKKVVHKPKVAWLASWKTKWWVGNVDRKQTTQMLLHSSSKIKQGADLRKYNKAHQLHESIDKIRASYEVDLESNKVEERERSVALYFIDKLAFRVGNEKSEDEADTMGCCSLRVEHIKLGRDQGFVVKFDFLGKDSIQYENEVSVDERVFRNLQEFVNGKQPNDQLFPNVNPTMINKYLNDQMEGLSAKVFRTCNASSTFQNKLDELTNAEDSIENKIESYKKANKDVAILCNHKKNAEKGSDKTEISLQSSKESYIDPRITFAWCEKFDVPIDKIFTKGDLKKFSWAFKKEYKKFRF